MNSTLLEVPLIVFTVGLGLALFVSAVVLAAHINAVDTLACIDLIKDKSAQDILLICKGR